MSDSKKPPRPAPPRPRPQIETGPTLPKIEEAAADDDQPTIPAPTSERGELLAPPEAEASSTDFKAVPSEPASSKPVSSKPLSSGPPRSLDWEDGSLDEKKKGDDEKEEPDPHIGTTIGDRYIVDEVIGEGGMGKVYLAHHKVIGKKVAIKILHSELARDNESVGRFVREARAASSVGNPHIVDIADFGELEDGSTYFVMEYLDGDDLGDLIDERGPLATELVLDIGQQLCDGLAAAHKQKIVHRDLKPDNVTLIEQGGKDPFCKILDFGIAKVSTGKSDTKLTMAGAVFGTPHYMSPEQAAGAAVDHRTDIYSLGVILYEMAAGELPFNADNFMGILTQHMYKAPVPIRALVGAPDVPPGLEAVILKALSKKPEARHQTMDELATDLRTLAEGGIPRAVHDMMERSGSFNVPADYFKTGAAVVKGPQGMRPARWGPRLVAIAGVVAAVGITAFVLIKDSTTTAAPEPVPPAPETTVEEAPPEPKKNEVLLGSDPTGATALIDGNEVSLPSIVPVPDGEKVSVTVKADGYQDKVVELDSANKRVVIKLEAAPKPETSSSAKPAVRPPRFPGKRKKKAKPGDIVNPWD